MVVGDRSDDLLEAGVLSDFDGNKDVVFAGEGDDLVDTTQSISGNSRIYGGSGKDELIVGKGDRAFGGKGDDTLDATVGRGSNRLYGNEGNDILFTERSDRAFGGNGNDTLYAGEDENILTGGLGKDSFWLATAELPQDANTIADFEANVDKIGIAGLDITYGDLSFQIIDSNTTISVMGRELAIVNNIGNLQASDFVFS